VLDRSFTQCLGTVHLAMEPVTRTPGQAGAGTPRTGKDSVEVPTITPLVVHCLGRLDESYCPELPSVSGGAVGRSCHGFSRTSWTNDTLSSSLRYR
jgi:hypothetical protein